jgi:hypothetical protein
MLTLSLLNRGIKDTTRNSIQDKTKTRLKEQHNKMARQNEAIEDKN